MKIKGKGNTVFQKEESRKKSLQNVDRGPIKPTVEEQRGRVPWTMKDTELMTLKITNGKGFQTACRASSAHAFSCVRENQGRLTTRAAQRPLR